LSPSSLLSAGMVVDPLDFTASDLPVIFFSLSVIRL